MTSSSVDWQAITVVLRLAFSLPVQRRRANENNPYTEITKDKGYALEKVVMNKGEKKYVYTTRLQRYKLKGFPGIRVDCCHDSGHTNKTLGEHNSRCPLLRHGDERASSSCAAR